MKHLKLVTILLTAFLLFGFSISNTSNIEVTKTNSEISSIDIENEIACLINLAYEESSSFDETKWRYTINAKHRHTGQQRSFTCIKCGMGNAASCAFYMAYNAFGEDLIILGASSTPLGGC
ncbi:hypothetical protein POV27_11985 [Aureisphaera galaxeae]|uniref:hypothetical protein n=1 Tax=Aureisphaera galaxeae TaxID=1538023 RepID=UPI002350AF52|nr:hypothetical protein [Aureisphaera galaxeae]MDC8004774.1 hypothetical protein [Aureisphaera galaxeae]